MALEEQPVDAAGDRRAGQIGDHLPIAARAVAQAAGPLDAVGRVEDHRPAGARHDRQAAEVVDQRVIAERRAALGEEDPGATAGLDLGGDVGHVFGRQELPFLYVDDPAGLGAGDQQVGLPAQECGDLQHVQGLCRPFGLGRLVDVGDQRQPERRLDLGQDLEPFVHARSAKGRVGGPVRLVVARLEDQRHAELGADLLQDARDRQGPLAALDDAGPRQQEERMPLAHVDLAAPGQQERYGSRRAGCLHGHSRGDGLAEREGFEPSVQV